MVHFHRRTAGINQSCEMWNFGDSNGMGALRTAFACDSREKIYSILAEVKKDPGTEENNSEW